MFSRGSERRVILLTRHSNECRYGSGCRQSVARVTPSRRSHSGWGLPMKLCGLSLP